MDRHEVKAPTTVAPQLASASDNARPPADAARPRPGSARRNARWRVDISPASRPTRARRVAANRFAVGLPAPGLNRDMLPSVSSDSVIAIDFPFWAAKCALTARQRAETLTGAATAVGQRHAVHAHRQSDRREALVRDIQLVWALPTARLLPTATLFTQLLRAFSELSDYVLSVKTLASSLRSSASFPMSAHCSPPFERTRR